eukprot:UN04237
MFTGNEDTADDNAVNIEINFRLVICSISNTIMDSNLAIVMITMISSPKSSDFTKVKNFVENLCQMKMFLISISSDGTYEIKILHRS